MDTTADTTVDTTDTKIDLPDGLYSYEDRDTGYLLIYKGLAYPFSLGVDPEWPIYEKTKEFFHRTVSEIERGLPYQPIHPSKLNIPSLYETQNYSRMDMDIEDIGQSFQASKRSLQ